MIGLVKQHDVTDCGPTCLASIALYYNLNLSIAKIRVYAGTDKNGTNLSGLILAAQKMGFEAKGVKTTSVGVKQVPLPAIAHIIVNKHLHHYVVLTRLTTRHVHFMDPADGKVHRKSIADFDQEWTGILLILWPSDEFKSGSGKAPNSIRFWNLLRPHKAILLQVLIGALFYTVLGLSTAIFVQKIADYVLVYANESLLNLMSVMMIVVLVLQIFIGTVKSLFTLRIGQQIDARLMLGYYKHLLKLPQLFFDTMRVGEIISRLNDAIKIRAFINEIAVNLVVNLFIIIFSFTLLFTYYWKLALLMLVGIPIYISLYLLSNAFNKRIQRKLMEESAALEAQLTESVSVAGTIKRLGLEDFAIDKTEARFVSLLRTVYQSGKASIFLSSSLQLISQLLTIMLLWMGAEYVLKQQITPGELFSFYTLVSYFTMPAASLVGANKLFQEALIASDR
ncbi:MAG: peptidase domain-containing ABC transporter [Bacteroidia bacterium]